MSNCVRKLSALVASLALFITAGAVNSACFGWVYQPELPEGADTLRKM